MPGGCDIYRSFSRLFKIFQAQVANSPMRLAGRTDRKPDGNALVAEDAGNSTHPGELTHRPRDREPEADEIAVSGIGTIAAARSNPDTDRLRS